MKTPPLTHDVPRALTNRETVQQIAIAEQRRLREIDEFWSRCTADPAGTALAAGTQIERDIAMLASAPPAPSTNSFPSLLRATASLLTDAVKNALACDGPGEAAVDSFWENGEVVASRSCECQQTYMIRYDGPLFNPGTLAPDSLGTSVSFDLQYVPSDGGHHSDYETIRAYVFASMGQDGAFVEARPELPCRGALMRDLAALEILVDQGRLSGAHFVTRPLPELATQSDAEISHLKAHRAALRKKGAVPDSQLAVLAQLTAPLDRRISLLRRRVRRIENRMHKVRQQILRIQAAALEIETGFAGGDRVRHVATGDEGVLEVVVHGEAQFRLQGTDMHVTEDIRRGEWKEIEDGGDTSEDGKQ